ncbi:MAG: cytochrome c3 family protein [Thermodesulfovibrionales bacterium]|nr:cytochrome c3 family protein [Thermodesulfovibrionales bacterium]
MEPDTHYKKGIHCIECHHTGRTGMGDMVRRAGCQDCHVEIEEAHSKSIHKNLDCASCHVNELRGYQLVVWGPGYVAERKNPFKKYSLYYGIQSPPIIMKDQKGKWMPVKIMPHSLGNFSKDVLPSDSIKFRWNDYSTRDAYYILGTFDAPSNNKHLLWLDLQQASHPYGKARKCESCHKQRQEMKSTWEYMDYQGANEPFSGSYKVVADENGLIVKDFRYGEIKVSAGYKLEDFASWVFFQDKWFIKGNFAINTDRQQYEKYLKKSKNIDQEIKKLDYLVKGKNKKIAKKIKTLREVVIHNQDIDIENLKERVKK